MNSIILQLTADSLPCYDSLSSVFQIFQPILPVNDWSASRPLGINKDFNLSLNRASSLLENLRRLYGINDDESGFGWTMSPFRDTGIDSLVAESITTNNQRLTILECTVKSMMKLKEYFGVVVEYFVESSCQNLRPLNLNSFFVP